MDSHRFDVVVIGAELSGLTAAAVAASRKQRVALVASGPGLFVLGSGQLNAREFIQQSATHEMGEAIAFFREMAAAAGCPFEGDVSESRYLPTILGEFQHVALAPRSLWNAEPRNGTQMAVVGIRELSCFDENFMAERLNEQARKLGLVCTYTARQISLTHIFGRSVTTLRIATRFDGNSEFRSELAGAMRLAASGFDRILVPGVLGLDSSGQQLAEFEHEVGCTLCELPTLPPSAPGLRLFYRMRKYLQEIGVELFEGFPVESARIHDGCCTELQISSPGHSTILRGDCVVLAAGRHSASLLDGAYAGNDEFMRPLTSAGAVMAWNLLVADSGGQEGAELSGDAAEILAGYRAGNLAADPRGRYAAG